MLNREPRAAIAFEGDRAIASGDLREVARAAKERLDRRKDAAIQIFDAATGAPVDIDFRGGLADVLARLPETAQSPAETDQAAAPASRGPGRPKLGVVAREVTLLPRHWDWLAQQRGGAEVAAVARQILGAAYARIVVAAGRIDIGRGGHFGRSGGTACPSSVSP